MATFTGTGVGDWIYGTSSADSIYGLGGNDNLLGYDGADYIDGGSGNDNVIDGDGQNPDLYADTLMGGDGDDFVYAGYLDQADGGTGTNDALILRLDHAPGYVSIDFTAFWTGSSYTIDGATLQNFEKLWWVVGTAYDDDIILGTPTGKTSEAAGGAGSDFLFGGAGTDHLNSAFFYAGPTVADTDFDRLEGLGGDDFLTGGLGDYLHGGSGTDRLTLYADMSPAGVSLDFTVLIATGSDTLLGTQMYSFEDVAGVHGSAYDDSINVGLETYDTWLSGGAGNDSLTGGSGANRIDGGAGADMMSGGQGNDTYYVDNVSDVVTENASAGSDWIRTSLATFSLAALPNVENLVGTSPAGQVLTGNGADNYIWGEAGNDTIHVWATGGNDSVSGYAGNDLIFFGATLTSADSLNGGDGVDTLVIQGNYGLLTLTAAITQIENISILAGSNTNLGEPGTNRYDYGLVTHDSNFAAGVQARINAAALLAGEDFTFNGSAETNASFVVYGGKGVDTLTGGLGNDVFFYAEDRFASGDTVNGGQGYDGMFLRGNYTIDFNAPGYTGLFTNIENLTLTSITDERYARGGGPEFDYDLILSNAIVGAGQTLTISGTFLLPTETMILDGSQESDGLLRLFGGKANDILKGGGQADLLFGYFGADSLTGGGGADTFRFQATADSTAADMDQILDFTPGTDKIALDQIDADSLAGGDQGFTWIGSGAFTGSAGQLRAYQSGATWFVEGDTDGNGGADLVIALTLQGAIPLGAADFML